MAQKHSWFAPFFAPRIEAAAAHPPVSRLWPLVVDRLPRRPARLRRGVEARADRWYHQQLAAAFREAWQSSQVPR